MNLQEVQNKVNININQESRARLAGKNSPRAVRSGLVAQIVFK